MNLKGFVFCAVMAAASAATAGPAAAQWGPYGSYRYGPVAVPAYAVAPALRAHGLRPVTQALQTGRYIVVRAADPGGQIVRVLINAEYGNIIQVTPLPPSAVYAERGYPAYGPPPYRTYEEQTYEVDPRYSGPRPDLKVEPAPPLARNEAYPGSDPTGPTVIRAPRATPASPPAQRSAAVTPPRTPLPRPRPAVKDATATAAAKPAPESPAAQPAAPQAATDGAASGSKPAAGAFPPAAPLE